MEQSPKNAMTLAGFVYAASLQRKNKIDAERRETKVHIAGAGGTLTAAYEQLRNAAEYAEEHLLLQHAIRRFYHRFF